MLFFFLPFTPAGGQGAWLPIASALAIGALTLGATPIKAQQGNAGQPTSLNEVTVTANRTATRIDETLADVTVIDRAQLERVSGRTLVEVLAQQPGVQFALNGGAGKISFLSLRGLESRHTLLLIDGVRYGSATVGTPTWETIPIESIERIEIVRGPLSGLYGSDAVGGVVQVFTRSGRQGLAVNAMAGVGSNRWGEFSSGLRFGDGTVDGALQVNHLGTRGFSASNSNVPFGSFNPDRDGFRQNSGNAQFGWRFAPGWRAQASVLRSDGVTQIDDGPNANSLAGIRSDISALQISGAVTPAWQTVLRLARSIDEYETLASASSFTTLGTIATTQQQYSWENTVKTPLGAVVLLAEHLKQNVRRAGSDFDVSSRNINGVAVGLNGKAGAHTWQGNLRHDSNSQFGSQSTGSLGYGYDLTSAWRLGGSYGTSFVAPSFNQLYFPGFGSPTLQPETGRHSEINLRWAVPGQQLRMALFDNRIRGYISSGPAPTNIPRTRIDGVTVSYQAMVANWTLAASLDHVDPRNATQGDVNFDKQLQRRAKDSLKLSADTQTGMWRYGGTVSAYSARYDNAANTQRLGGFATLDTRADWLFARQWTLGLRLNNLTGKVYETVYGYNQPGREVFVTLRYSGL